MRHYILLEQSSLEKDGGKAVFKKVNGKPREVGLIRGEDVDERIVYEFLNPLQTLFYLKYKGGNCLVTAPTSAGKSLIAFLFMREKEGRKVYLAPTKSLVYEKVVELRRYYGNRIDIRTGDIIDIFKSARGEVTVATFENFALALRNKLPWTKNISCVVIDEIHHITTSRGFILEEVITYLLERDIDILGLSATLPGSIEMAKWIKADLFIESLWRPVPLERRIIPLVEFEEFTKAKGSDEKIASRLLTAVYELKKPTDQVILFVHKKGVGWKLLEIANREKIGIMNRTLPFEKEEREEIEIAFHNADIPKEEREEIERAFRKGELPILVATQTMAYGVNLPADTVIVSVKAFFDQRTRKWKTIPDALDILQMEGRAGRLGIKEKGYSFILPYGMKEDKLKKEIEKGMNREFKPFLKETVESEEMDMDHLKALSLFVLLGVLYEGGNFKNFLKKTYSLKEFVNNPVIENTLEWLKDTGYIGEDFELSDKAIFCIRSGVSPVNYEEFLYRKKIGIYEPALIRPLLFTKRFDSLYDFVKEGETFEEDHFYVLSLLSTCGGSCTEDNTHQFVFYIEGLTFKYKNIQAPPSDFSYLGTDVLHLARTLKEIRSIGDIDWNDLKILTLCHSIKYGISPDYASLGGIKGIGHIRANLLKRLMIQEKIKPPSLGEKTEALIDLLKDTFGENLKSRLEEILLFERYKGEADKTKVQREAQQLIKILENNRKGNLIDDRILRTFMLFTLGEKALRMKKDELIKELLITC